MALPLAIRKGAIVAPRGSKLGVTACVFYEGCDAPAMVTVTDFTASPFAIIPEATPTPTGTRPQGAGI